MRAESRSSTHTRAHTNTHGLEKYDLLSSLLAGVEVVAVPLSMTHFVFTVLFAENKMSLTQKDMVLCRFFSIYPKCRKCEMNSDLVERLSLPSCGCLCQRQSV